MQILVAALVGLAAYVGWRLVAREMRRVGRVFGDAKLKPQRVPASKRLVRGPDGVYRPET